MPGSEHWKNVLIVIPIVGTSIATAFFLCRLYCRRLARVRVKVEDFLMGIGLLFTYGVTVCFVMQGFSGIGVDGDDLPQHHRERLALVAWLSQKFWPPAQVFVKISIIVFFRRLMDSPRRIRRFATGLMVFTVIWGLTAIIGNTFQCWPPQYFWIRDIDGDCMSGQNTFFTVMGTFSLVEDIVILCLPMPIVWRLQMDVKRKVEMMVLFSIGGVVCVFSLLRLIYFRIYRVDNLSATTALESIWTILELDVAIICGSLLLMKPLCQACLGKIKHRISSTTRKDDPYPTPRSLIITEPDTIFTRGSGDGYSEIRADICRTPTDELAFNPFDRSFAMEMGRIRVDTSINQGTEIQSDSGSTGRSSRRGSILPLYRPTPPRMPS